jgi:hypothetical protein
MKHILLLSFALFFAAPTLSAQLPHLIFHAELKGAEQIPSVNTPARGLITIMYSPDRTKVSVTGLFVDMEGDITDVSLHIGSTGETGDLIVDLTPLLNFRRLYGEVEVPSTLLQNLLVKSEASLFAKLILITALYSPERMLYPQPAPPVSDLAEYTSRPDRKMSWWPW